MQMFQIFACERNDDLKVHNIQKYIFANFGKATIM